MHRTGVYVRVYLWKYVQTPYRTADNLEQLAYHNTVSCKNCKVEIKFWTKINVFTSCNRISC